MKRVQVIALVFLTLATLGVSAQQTLSKTDQKTVVDFEKRLNRYAKDRRKLLAKQAPLPDKATPEQITAHKTALQNAVKSLRVNAKPGDIFTQQIALLVKQLIKNEYPAWEAGELRKSVLEADTNGVPVVVNVAYPESKELVAMSPALLLRLPQLPKELRYRFIGSNLVIMDRDNALILDFIKNALP